MGEMEAEQKNHEVENTEQRVRWGTLHNLQSRFQYIGKRVPILRWLALIFYPLVVLSFPPTVACSCNCQLGLVYVLTVFSIFVPIVDRATLATDSVSTLIILLALASSWAR